MGGVTGRTVPSAAWATAWTGRAGAVRRVAGDAVPQVGPRNPATQVEHAPLPFVPLQVAGSQVPWLMSQVMAVQVEPK